MAVTGNTTRATSGPTSVIAVAVVTSILAFIGWMVWYTVGGNGRLIPVHFPYEVTEASEIYYAANVSNNGTEALLSGVYTTHTYETPISSITVGGSYKVIHGDYIVYTSISGVPRFAALGLEVGK